MVNNIKNNAISEVDAKKRSNTLKIIKNSEIEHRRLIPGQKELLKLFDLLDTILTDKTFKSESQENKNKKMKIKMKMKMIIMIMMRMKIEMTVMIMKIKIKQ